VINKATIGHTCRSHCGFQSLSYRMTVSAVCRLRPSPPLRVDARKMEICRQENERQMTQACCDSMAHTLSNLDITSAPMQMAAWGKWRSAGRHIDQMCHRAAHLAAWLVELADGDHALHPTHTAVQAHVPADTQTGRRATDRQYKAVKLWSESCAANVQMTAQPSEQRLARFPSPEQHAKAPDE
jgi:hypothetical protein